MSEKTQEWKDEVKQVETGTLELRAWHYCGIEQAAKNDSYEFTRTWPGTRVRCKQLELQPAPTWSSPLPPSLQPSVCILLVTTIKIYLAKLYLQNHAPKKTTMFVTTQNEGVLPLPNAVCSAHSSMCSDSDIGLKFQWFQSGLALSSAPRDGLPRVCGLF